MYNAALYTKHHKVQTKSSSFKQNIIIITPSHLCVHMVNHPEVHTLILYLKILSKNIILFNFSKLTDNKYPNNRIW